MTADSTSFGNISYDYTVNAVQAIITPPPATGSPFTGMPVSLFAMGSIIIISIVAMSFGRRDYDIGIIDLGMMTLLFCAMNWLPAPAAAMAVTVIILGILVRLGRSP